MNMATAFRAEFSLYASSVGYATTTRVGSTGRSAPPYATRGLRNGGGNGGGCRTHCTPCDSNCERTCTNSCTGESNTIPCCGSGFACQAGKCVCPSPRTICGGLCTDTQSDPNHCGQCGTVCPSGTTCQQGDCYPKPMQCGACSPAPNSVQTCCQQVSPDQNLCGITACAPGCGTQPYPWCGQSSPTVISCPCPTGQECRSRCQGELCSVDWFCQPPLPVCETINGACTGAGGADQCITAGGVTQCCHSNWLYGWYPWIIVCSDGTVGGQGCSGPCY
jgi:hypothetical protein